jgi:hypothetical protein
MLNNLFFVFLIIAENDYPADKKPVHQDHLGEPGLDHFAG